MRQTRRMQKRMQNRSGATLVMVSIWLFVLIGMAGIAIDFARMYAFRAQLQTIADASAQAGAMQLMFQSAGIQPVTAVDSAMRYNALDRNTVNGVPADMTEFDVLGGQWHDDTRTFDSLVAGKDAAGWQNPSINAVKVKARYTGGTTLSRIFGAQTLSQGVFAVGALGSLSGSTCLKPWAVPYQALLWTINKPYATNDDLNYVMGPEDIDLLRETTMAKGITIKFTAFTKNGQDSTVSENYTNTDPPLSLPGNYFPVRFGPVEYADGSPGNPESGANSYRDWIRNDCSVTPAPLVSVGDWLQAEQGNKIGPTNQGMRDICTSSPEAPTPQHCWPPLEIHVPIYANFRSSGGLPQFQVKYIGAFIVTEFKGTGQWSEVKGYFSSFITSGGTWSANAGPITSMLLVQ